MNFSRKHINNNQIPEIELDKLDEFELDAREGWSELEIEDLNRLDLRFKANRSRFKLSFTVLFFSTFIISILLYEAHKRENSPKEVSKKNQSHTNTINEAYNPIKLPNKKLELIAQHKQIIPQKIQSDLKQQRKLEVENLITQSDDRRRTIDIEAKPVSDISTVALNNNAKEVYLQDLLVVDYKFYRKRDPLVLSPQLTGTPANESSKSEEQLSTQELEVSYMNYLSKTLKLFNNKRFQDAIFNFEIILSKYPDDVNALFYEAIALYNLGLNKDAIRRLNQLQLAPFSNFHEDQKWYLLLCYKAERNQEKFHSLRSQIIGGKGYYWLRAQQLEY
jgi:hypothetical protein